MSLGAATVFAIPPDGNTEPEITRSYLTDGIRARAGTEKRAALRSAPVRQLRYTALFTNQTDASDFRVAWLAATERLRFLVPLWPEYAVPTSFPTSSTIAADFTNRDFAPFAKVLVWQDRAHFEPATISALTGSLLTLTAPLAGTYAPFAARVLPLMPAWLDVPTMTMLETASETVPVVFHEEVQGAAVTDPTLGLAAAATCTNLVVETIYSNGTGLAGRLFFGWRIHAYDAAGVEIPNPSPVWTIAVHAGSPATLSAPTKFTVTADGREAGLRFVGDADWAFDLTVTVGSVTSSFSVSG